MALLTELLAELDRLLEPDTFADYCPNGLQVQGCREVTHVATGVSATLELFERAIDAGAQLILTHHGLFWQGDDQRVVGALHERLRLLMGADVSLAAYHLPLDAHLELGNNALIAAGLGLADPQPFGRHGEREIGVRARYGGDGVAAGEFVARVSALTGRAPLAFLGGPPMVCSVGIVSGGAARSVHDAIAAGLDAFVTGEPAEWASALAQEASIHFIAAGHYATETFGVNALGQHLATRFGVRHTDVRVDNPV
ncbi:MAG: Nif3-like dinuclear metal center hexameric protein [Solirubrobacteraceae bacterium]|jgi:dinuclear metal center YbgI/SA1388 family protein